MSCTITAHISTFSDVHIFSSITPRMNFKEKVTQALKSIIKRQNRLGLSSRFIFSKIMKEVNNMATLNNWEELEKVKFVGEKTLLKIKEEAQLLIGETPAEFINEKIHKEENVEHPNTSQQITTQEIKVSLDSYVEHLKATYIGIDEDVVTSRGKIIYKDGSLDAIIKNSSMPVDGSSVDETSSDLIVLTDKSHPDAVTTLESIMNSFSELDLEDPWPTRHVSRADASSFMNTSTSLDMSSVKNTREAELTISGSQRKGKYIPRYRTAAYAILKALYRNNGAHKHLIVLKATPHTDAVFDRNQRFSAFSSFKTLQKKGLIHIEADSRCYLTDTGNVLCTTMFRDESFGTTDDQEVQIVIDSREKKSNADRVYFQSHFSKHGIPNQTRYLNVGDFIWIKNERVVDIIVERKQTTDLVSSISDGRFREQKNRLKSLGFTVFYLIENLKVDDGRRAYVNKCMLTIRVGGFVLLETENIQETCLVLEKIDKLIRESEKNKTVVSYGSFLNEGEKGNLKVGGVLLMALLSVKGVSKAFAISLCEKYKTLAIFRKEMMNEEFRETLSRYKINGKILGVKIASRIITLLEPI